MRENRKKTIRTLLLIFILFLGLGFAALAANLKIDGTVNVSRTAWDVHFENVQIKEGSVTANPAPTTNNTDTTEMTYTINFTKPGDYFEFTTDIVNEGTIDAMVDVVSNNAYANASSTTPIALPTYLTNTVTYEDGTPILQNQKLDHNTSEKIKVRIEFKKDISVSDLPSSGDTSVVFKFIGDYKQADENSVVVRRTIGETINYSTTLNNVTLDNWKVFYTEGEYTYLIYGDYLPKDAIDTSNISGINPGGDYGFERDIELRLGFINALTTKSNWDSLLSGTINGKTINETRTENTWAIGTPTFELWVDSWNKSYPNDKLYISQTSSNMNDGLKGYYIGFTENPHTNAADPNDNNALINSHFEGYEVNLSNREGYNNSLYFPYKNLLQMGEYGYWIAAATALNDSETYSIYADGSIYWGSDSYYFSIRPIIKLKTILLN